MSLDFACILGIDRFVGFDGQMRDKPNVSPYLTGGVIMVWEHSLT